MKIKDLALLILLLLNYPLCLGCTKKSGVNENSVKGIKGLNDIDWREYYFPYAKADYELLNRNDPNDKILIAVEAVSISPLKIKYTKEFSKAGPKSITLYEVDGQTITVVSHQVNGAETLTSPQKKQQPFNSITQFGKTFGPIADKKFTGFFSSTTIIHSAKVAKIMKVSEIKKSTSVKVTGAEGDEFYVKGIGLVSATIHNAEYIINRESSLLKCLKDKAKSSPNIDTKNCTNTLSRGLPTGIKLN